jgi:hypothetical protein
MVALRRHMFDFVCYITFTSLNLYQLYYLYPSLVFIKLFYDIICYTIHRFIILSLFPRGYFKVLQNNSFKVFFLLPFIFSYTIYFILRHFNTIPPLSFWFIFCMHNPNLLVALFSTFCTILFVLQIFFKAIIGGLKGGYEINVQNKINH